MIVLQQHYPKNIQLLARLRIVGEIASHVMFFPVLQLTEIINTSVRNLIETSNYFCLNLKGVNPGYERSA